jgi:putative Ca2+/H+ antiporter (TMEM165/GDT1 family)
MDYKVFLTSFAVVFLAEIGDRTQLAVFAFSAAGESKLAVFLGASLALVLSTLAAVFLGEIVYRYLPVRAAHIAAGVMFIAIGGLLLFSEFSK